MIKTFDLLMYIFSVLPVVASWGSLILVISHAENLYLQIIYLLAAPIYLVVTLSASVILLRLLMPKLKKGIYPVGVNKGYLSWYANLCLLRSMYISGLKPLIHSAYLFRFIFYKALGAKISYDIHTSIHFEIVDAPLVSIGKNTIIQDNVKISCHQLMKDKLILRPVRIEDNCVLVSSTEVKAGSVIKSMRNNEESK